MTDFQIYHGDMRDILPALDRKVQMICTDAIYELTSGGQAKDDGEHQTMSGMFSGEQYNNNGAILDGDIDWPEMMPVMFDAMDRGHAYFMCNDKNIFPAGNAAIAAGFHFHNMLVWDKVTATANRWYMKNCEFTLFMKKGKAFKINDCRSKQLIKSPNNKQGYHKTEKPVELMEYYIRNSTQPGDTVLDPFMGGGSTAIAALKSGRKFIGCELDLEIFNTAKARIEAFKANTQFSLIQ